MITKKADPIKSIGLAELKAKIELKVCPLGINSDEMLIWDTSESKSYLFESIQKPLKMNKTGA